MSERTHLSIGEVLSLLQGEFSDITISKIRFLESQGLVDPERTPSGYRKFYEEDVERLRWILRQQRENFLPLKVIKGRLYEHGTEEAGDEAAVDEPAGDTDALRSGPDGSDERQRSHRADAESAGPVPAGLPPTTTGDPGRPEGRLVPAPPGAAAPAAFGPAHPATGALGAAGPVATGRTGGAAGPARPVRSTGGPATASGSVTLDELATATGLAEEQVRDLVRFGLLTSRDVGGTAYFDQEAVTVATLAAGFARHGVEARHLRTYKNAAERESGLFEQVVMPLIKQRNPGARLQALAMLDELGRLSRELREVLLRQALRDAF